MSVKLRAKTRIRHKNGGRKTVCGARKLQCAFQDEIKKQGVVIVNLLQLIGFSGVDVALLNKRSRPDQKIHGR